MFFIWRSGVLPCPIENNSTKLGCQTNFIHSATYRAGVHDEHVVEFDLFVGIFNAKFCSVDGRESVQHMCIQMQRMAKQPPSYSRLVTSFPLCPFDQSHPIFQLMKKSLKHKKYWDMMMSPIQFCIYLTGRPTVVRIQPRVWMCMSIHFRNTL